MTRIAAIALIALATGCAEDHLVLEQQGTVWTEARGVAFQEDGARVHMGMDWGTTCAFDLGGGFQEDFDFPTETDRIHDARDGMALGTSSQGLHFIGHELTDIALPAVVDAALTARGGVALTNLQDSCEVQFVGASGTQAVAIGEGCEPSEVEAFDDIALVGAFGGAMLVSADGAVVELDGADQVAVSRSLDQAYSGATAGSTLFASSLDGAQLWSADLGGELVDVADMGGAGLVVASVDHGREGALLFLDAVTGDTLGEVRVPTAEKVEASEDGGTIAVVDEWETRLYTVEDGKGFRFVGSAGEAGLATAAVMD